MRILYKINNLPPHELIAEFNAIKVKKSNLTRGERDIVCKKVAYLVRKGTLVVNTGVSTTAKHD